MSVAKLFEELAQTDAAAEMAHIPEYAWRHRFIGDEIQMSWRACQAYGLDPVKRVALAHEEFSLGVEQEKPKEPRALNLAVVAPEELRPAIRQMMGSVIAPEFEGNFVAIPRRTRLNMVVSFPLTRQSTREDQAHFLEDEDASDDVRLEWQRRINNDAKSALPYAVGHSLVNLVMEQFRIQNSDRQHASLRASQAGRLVHSLLFDDQHVWRPGSRV